MNYKKDKIVYNQYYLVDPNNPNTNYRYTNNNSNTFLDQGNLDQGNLDQFTMFLFTIMYFVCFCCAFKSIYIKCDNYITNRRNRIKTPRLNYIKMDDEDSLDNCVICLENIDSKSVKLKCNHIFHKKCIKKWIEETRNTDNNFDMNCPLCKTDIV